MMTENSLRIFPLSRSSPYFLWALHILHMHHLAVTAGKKTFRCSAGVI